jgi:exopolysaccharide biosynthesis protein
MLQLGCTDAVNLDGGASAAMYYNGSILRTPGRELTSILLIVER